VRLEKEILLHAGAVHASAEPAVIKTLLGSCIAVCLWDPAVRVGGMNHFMLPQGTSTGPQDDPARFGVHAMDRLVGEMLKLGASPARFVVKVFGGASVLTMQGAGGKIPQSNVAFVRDYLAREHMRAAAMSVGGTLPRQIRFFTQTGKVLVRRVVTLRTQERLSEREAEQRRLPGEFGDVTLFRSGRR
jgi:chemotaxis receptor (MCP) glutamine deamidase CheD